MTEPSTEPLPNEGRLDRRRIQATVLERRAELRRRRWRIIAVGVLLVIGIQTAIYAIHACMRGEVLPALATGIFAGSFLFGAGFVGWPQLSTGKRPPNAPVVPPDFTGMGSSPNFAERLEQLSQDDNSQ